MRRCADRALVFCAAFASLSPDADARFREAPASIEVPGGTLHGTLALPADDGTAAIVLIHPGSGPVDRNGNLPGYVNNSLKMLAEALAGHGIASLRIDKRGVGESRAAIRSVRDLRIEHYAADVERWASYLHRKPGINHVFLLGHSEGALIVTLAARKTSSDGLILIAGPGEPVGRVVLRQLRARGVRGPLMTAAEAAVEALEAGHRAENLPPPLVRLFPADVQPYLMSEFRLDPAAELGRTTGRVLVVQGETDVQVSAEDARRLSSARPGISLVTVQHMNHVLKAAPADYAGNVATYSEPDRPLAAGLADAIADFVGR